MTLVTGGLGFIGLNLLKQLDGVPYDLKNGQDICDRDQLSSIYRGGPIVHLAAQSGIPQSIDQPDWSFLHNTAGTYYALELARAHNARFIFASSAAADTLSSPYGASKAAGEAYIQAYHACYGLSYAILRLSNIYGPLSDHKTSCVSQMIRDALNIGKITVHGDGEQLRDFVHVNDVCNGISDFIHNDDIGIFDIATGIKTKVIDVANMISGQTGAEIVFTENREKPVNPSPTLRFKPNMIELEYGIEDTISYFRGS